MNQLYFLFSLKWTHDKQLWPYILVSQNGAVFFNSDFADVQVDIKAKAIYGIYKKVQRLRTR